MSYTAVYVESSNSTVLGFVPELPGAHASGRTVEETRERLRAVLKVTLEANRQCCFKSADGIRQLHSEPIDEIP
jgi:predicted RNase H-like HicB family nuclease